MRGGAAMKKWMIFLLTVSLFLCSCGKKESYPNLEFPGTTWEMSIRGVLNALNLKEKDISYIYITPSGINSVLCIEGYELFGTKTKSVDLQFLDLSEPPKKEPSKEGQGLFGKKQYGIDEHLLDLVDHHELSEIIVTYPKDTDMDQILNEMKKIYGTTIPEMTMRSLQEKLETVLCLEKYGRCSRRRKLGYVYPHCTDAVHPLPE